MSIGALISAEEIDALQVVLEMTKVIFESLDRLRKKKQLLCDQLRVVVYNGLMEELGGHRLAKDDFDSRLRERWNQNGGAKIYAELKNSEKTATAAQALVEAIESRLAGK